MTWKKFSRSVPQLIDEYGGYDERAGNQAFSIFLRPNLSQARAKYGYDHYAEK